MARTIRDEDALHYHVRGRPGKIEVVPTKPCFTQRDLSLAYSPGVAVPCLEIEKNPDDVFKYTAKGNLVAVVSNGTAVLGLGNIGPAAGKPVMEGKGVLFKRFADIDVFDIEVDTNDVDEFVNCVRLISPTFGGINLEDLRAPECFEIEPRLQELLDIPVFHDDQHGTAIIAAAGLLNALELAGKDPAEVRIVFSGAGASAMGCASHFLRMGVNKENIIMTDRTGVIYTGRDKGMNKWKETWAVDTELRTLDDALKGADVFMGLSVANMINKDHVRSMADNPVIFAMANPDPEISYPDARDARTDVIMGTGRSDYPNQVNNVLGFPFIFRGALDVRARAINDEMKIAASRALAKLARQDIPDIVLKAYGTEDLKFGPEYIIPKPFDPRILTWVAPAVAKAAVDTGVSRIDAPDWEEYKERLERIYGPGREIMRRVIRKVTRKEKRIVFPEGLATNILRACQIVLDEKIARPILIGNPEEIRAKAESLSLDVRGAEIVDPTREAEHYVKRMLELRGRKGMMPHKARSLMQTPLMHGVMMLHVDEADGLVCGVNRSYSETLGPSLGVLQLKEGVRRVSGMFAIVSRERTLFFADATVNIDPTAEELAEIAVLAAKTIRDYFDIEPRIAMLSFSSFGSTRHPFSEKVRRATELVKGMDPTLTIDGEIQADAALNPDIIENVYPHSALKGDANLLVFPCLNSANIAYKLMERLTKAEVIGPIIIGMRKPVSVVNHWSTADQVVNITAITALAATSTFGMQEEAFRQRILERVERGE